MSYGIDYKTRTIEYRKEGNTLELTKQTFKVSITTIRRWEKEYDSEEGFVKKPLNRSFKKIDPQKLAEHVAQHPDAYLKEIAEEFQCDESAIRQALKRQGITRKKRRSGTRNKTRQRS